MLCRPPESSTGKTGNSCPGRQFFYRVIFTPCARSELIGGTFVLIKTVSITIEEAFMVISTVLITIERTFIIVERSPIVIAAFAMVIGAGGIFTVFPLIMIEGRSMVIKDAAIMIGNLYIIMAKPAI